MTAVEAKDVEHEPTLTRYERAFTAIRELAWPDCTCAQAESPHYLNHLVAKVEMVCRMAANDSQAWQVVQKTIQSNASLAALVATLREEARDNERELRELALRVTRLERELEIAQAAYVGLCLVDSGETIETVDNDGKIVLRSRHGFDGMGANFEDIDHPLGHVS